MPILKPLSLVATCSIGLDRLLVAELRSLGLEVESASTGAVAFRGDWQDVFRANWRLRTANRVLIELATWNGHDGDAL
ncbi:MAG: THUMP domain-containing protein [Acidobacteriota bacterium]